MKSGPLPIVDLIYFEQIQYMLLSKCVPFLEYIYILITKYYKVYPHNLSGLLSLPCTVAVTPLPGFVCQVIYTLVNTLLEGC